MDGSAANKYSVVAPVSGEDEVLSLEFAEKRAVSIEKAGSAEFERRPTLKILRIRTPTDGFKVSVQTSVAALVLTLIPQTVLRLNSICQS